MGEAVLAEFVEGFLLPGTPGLERGMEMNVGESLVVFAADIKESLELVELGLVEREAFRRDPDGLYHALGNTDKSEFPLEISSRDKLEIQCHG